MERALNVFHEKRLGLIRRFQWRIDRCQLVNSRARAIVDKEAVSFEESSSGTSPWKLSQNYGKAIARF